MYKKPWERKFSKLYQSTTTFKAIKNHNNGSFKGKHFLGVYIGPLHRCNLVVEIVNHNVTALVLIGMFLFMFLRLVSTVAVHYSSIVNEIAG